MRSEKSLHPKMVRAVTEEHIPTASLSRLPRARLNTLSSEECLSPSKKLPSLRVGQKHSPIKFYQSKIALSCQSWAAFSSERKQYKRGYRPTKVVPFKGFLKLLLVKVYLQLQKEKPSVQTVLVRTNRYLLREDVREKSLTLAEQKRRKVMPKKQDPCLFAQNTSILLRDLVFANFYSEYSDVQQYSVIFMGKLLREMEESSELEGQTLCFCEPREGLAPKGRKECVERFLKFGNDRLAEEQFVGTSANSNFDFVSSPEEMCRIWAGMLELPQFVGILRQREVVCRIKYQLGYRFFEERKLRVCASWPEVEGHLVVKWEGKVNCDVASFNLRSGNVVVMNDCKYSMEEVDLARIENFLAQLAKPVVSKEKRGGKQEREGRMRLPVLRMSD